jgi:hypothetical protein
MPTPSVPDGFGRASMEFTLDGASHVCVMTFNFADHPASSPDALASAVRIAWTGAFALNTLADTWNVGPWNVLINRDGLEVTGQDATSQNGTAAFEPSPIGACGIARKRTGISGRGFRGRMWLPGGYLGDTSVDDDGSIDATLLGDTNDRLEDFRTNLVAASIPMFLLGTSTNVVTSMDLAPKLHWLRRRAR